jgi:NAD(P)-dependent dehydrogenase (short-subunit alcohol dehydrogenase family)
VPDLTGAVVTGAGRGLGLEIARRLAARGLAVNVTDVDRDAARAAAEQLGDPAWATELDVRDAQACRAIARETAERAGSLDVWVNNAGILVTGFVWDHDEALRRTVIEVNALGTFNGTDAALELMRPAGRGHVINIISLAGLVAAPGEALYAASKHAAIAYTLGALNDLRRSGERSVQVSAVCPDGIWTPMLQDKLDDPAAAVSFAGHFMRPETVADAAVGLLDRPRALLTIPRRRAIFIRFADLFPGLSNRLLPLVLADARRKQRRWKQRIESGRGP